MFSSLFSYSLHLALWKVDAIFLARLDLLHTNELTRFLENLVSKVCTSQVATALLLSLVLPWISVAALYVSNTILRFALIDSSSEVGCFLLRDLETEGRKFSFSQLLFPLSWSPSLSTATSWLLASTICFLKNTILTQGNDEKKRFKEDSWVWTVTQFYFNAIEKNC